MWNQVIYLMAIAILCIISVGNVQTICNKPCVNGNPVYDAHGNCTCKCVLKFTGKFCTIPPNCGGKSCGSYGSLRGDCECDCVKVHYGERCQEFRCPYRDHHMCGHTNFTDCESERTLQQCPYYCHFCHESLRPKLKKTNLIHISQYGCIYEGLRPSIEMCKTLGNNGDDKTSCFEESDVDRNCRSCGHFSRHALVNCPVMCALCDKPDISSTTASVTSTTQITYNSSATARVSPPTTAKHDREITTITRNLTHVPTNRQRKETSLTLEPREIAAVVLGVVLAVVIISVVIDVLYKRNSCSKTTKRTVNQSLADVFDDYYENTESGHYVQMYNVEDETCEILSTESSANRANNRA